MGAGTLVLAGLLWAASAPPAGAPIYMKDRAIQIPININPERRNEIRELLLFVSADQGKSWTQEARATADKKSFPFNAPQDGTYWFTVCVIDAAGQREPRELSPNVDKLIVVMDSQAPIVQLTTGDRVNDEIAVQWSIQEPYPDPTSLRLEYRSADDPAATWNSVAINPGPNGSVRFPVSFPGSVFVKMSFADAAKNQTTVMKKITADAAPAITTNRIDTPALGPTIPAGGPMLLGNVVSVPPEVPGPVVPPVIPRIEPSNPPRMDAPPAMRVEPPPPIERAPAISSNTLAPIASSSRNEIVREPFHPTRDGSMTPVASNVPPTPAARPENRNTQLLNSKQITLSYNVVREGPSGVRRAYLYVTDNDGQSWTQAAVDDNQTQKLTANLPGEGIFGFRVVLESGAGLSKGPPKSGDAPELRVEVDMTAPDVVLYQPAPDPSYRDHLVLQWSATDKNLSTNPIELEYSESETGPWVRIATVPNSGLYSWKLPAKMPVRVYLRVIARDLAGNVGEARTPTPQLIDLHKPEGTITNITGATVQVRPNP